jgi:cytochrome c
MKQNILTHHFRKHFFGFVALDLITAALFVFPLLSSATGDTAGDVARGKLLFEKRCTGCHSLDRDKEGPRLGNVYGRPAGTVATFKYSDALRSAHITWNDDLLDKWLTDPDSLIPDNDMDFHVPKADERADIIRFLRASAGR